MYQLTKQELFDVNGGSVKLQGTVTGLKYVQAISFVINSIIKLFR